MSKFAILGDCHIGCRSDAPIFYEFQQTFFEDMVKFLVANNITHIFQLGDLWDRRKYINFYTLNKAKTILFNLLRDNNITMTTLLGNHDIFWRDSLEINSSTLLLPSYTNITVIDKPTTIILEDQTTIDLIPWICKENNRDIMTFITNSQSELCFGHLEIKTFSMYRGMESFDGYPIDMFAKYEMVCSGHFHTRTTKDNITYVGTPYEMTWQDYNDPKGFHVFDTQTRKLTFVENFNPIFVRLEYDGINDNNINPAQLTNKFVKVVVSNKDDTTKFEQFIQEMYNAQCYELKIIDDSADYVEGSIAEDIDLEDTVDVMYNYINSIEIEDPTVKETLKTFMKSLYFEAVNGAV